MLFLFVLQAVTGSVTYIGSGSYTGVGVVNFCLIAIGSEYGLGGKDPLFSSMCLLRN